MILQILLILALLMQPCGGDIMAGGADSTLILRPDGLSAISFDCSGAESRGSGGYVVPLQSLRLNEDERLEVAYSQGASMDGGEAISSHGPLVPVTFNVAVYGNTLANMMSKADDLIAAVTNEDGGTLQYKPDGLGAGVRSTYYHYEQSKPPKPQERWDKGPHSSGLYRMQFDVELQTQPFATSDPDTPVVVKTATTVYNQDDSVAGSITVSGSDIKGSVGALTQLRIRNLESGAWKAIGRLFYARRTEGLDNFDPILEGGTPDTDSSVHWSTESDTTRRSNNYQRYKPPEAANDQWASLSYTLSNPTDHKGRAAVVVVCRNMSESRLNWDLKASFEVADVEVETSIVNTERVGAFHIVVLGEIDIPPTPISADESYAPVVKLYLRRTSGEAAIDIDFADLLFVDEYPQQVDIEEGFTDAYRLLLENFVQELCHVVAQDTLAFEKTAQALCPLLQLKPGVDNRIDFIWQRIVLDQEVLVDDFEDYEAWRWLPMQDCEDTNEWSTDANLFIDGSYNVEGSYGLRLNGSSPAAVTCWYTPDEPWDLTAEGRFGDDDFLYITTYTTETVEDIEVNFVTSAGNYYVADLGDLNGRYFNKVKKSDCSSTGSPDWSNITAMRVSFVPIAGTKNLYFDDIRLVRADPDDAAKGNATGSVWDFALDRWHIEEQGSTSKALGCIDVTAGLEQVALIHEEPIANIKFLAKVKAKRDDGEVGLVFRCEDGTSGSEDMAAFFIDTSNDELELRKWAAGSASDIATAVSQTTAPDTDYWLGVWLIGSTVICYFGTSEAAIWDGDTQEFVASARVFNETDSDLASGGALAGGQAGLLSIGTLGRFDDVELYNIGDGHIPGDTLEVYLQAIFRSIYPFNE